MIVYHATLETRNFSFEAFGETSQEAVESLRRGWNLHRAEYPGVLQWSAFLGDVHVHERWVGPYCYRDGKMIHDPKPRTYRVNLGDGKTTRVTVPE